MPADQLRELVWNEPTNIIAKRFGVSDHTVEKRCVEYGIPKPPIGYWQRLEVGKIDRAGNLTIPLISCACGCGQLVPKWSGKLLRPARCARGHNARHHEGGWAKAPLDINVLAIIDCQTSQHDITQLATAITLDLTHRNFCEYIGPVWIAVSSAWMRGERISESLREVAKNAINQYWAEVRGRGWKEQSLDHVKEAYGLELAVAADD